MKRKRRVLTYRTFLIDTFSRLTKQGITEGERTREAKRAREKKEANLSRSEQRSMRRPFEVQVELKSNVTGILLPVNMSSTSLFCVLFWTHTESAREATDTKKEWFLQTYPISIWRVSLHFATFPSRERQLEKIDNVYTRLVFGGNERSNRSRRNIASNRPACINRSSSVHRFLFFSSPLNCGLVHRSNDFLFFNRLGIVARATRKKIGHLCNSR